MKLKIKILMSYLLVLKRNKQNSNLNSLLNSNYESLIQELIKESLEKNVLTLECYELLLLSNLHPIFDQKQKSTFCDLSILLRESYFAKKYPTNNDSLSSLFAQANSNSMKEISPANSSLIKEDSSFSKSLGFYSNSFDQEENSYSSLNKSKKPSTFKENNYFIDENELSSSLNVSLHIQSSNSDNAKTKLGAVGENMKSETKNPNEADINYKAVDNSVQKVFKHPSLKNTRSLPMWNRSLVSSNSNSLSKGFES